MDQKEKLKLRPYDIVAYKAVKGKEKSAFYRFIRSMSGAKNIDKKNVPVHSGIVVPINGENKIVEMKFKEGLVANPIDLESERFIGVTRLKLSNNEKAKIKKSIEKDLGRDIPYSKKSMAPTYIYRNKNKKDLLDSICSEYVARKVDKYSKYKTKEVWHRITPADMAKDNSFTVKGENAGVYIPRKALIETHK